ncbi:MAG TPA: class A beta-lactamase [Thermoanaerobaculia bacterium]|nr:class A beta-lactamase [Thermoanaerobaculia bacterium]
MFWILLAALFQPPPQTTDATIGVAAIHLESGRRIAIHADERFPMGSVYKFAIAIAVLRRVDAGKLSLGENVTITEFSPGWSPLRDRAKGKPITVTQRELLELMLRDSDNTPCDYYIRKLGAKTITQEIGIAGIRIDREERVIAADIGKSGVPAYVADARDTATPNAMLELLMRFWSRRLGLSDASHALAVKLMTETKTGAKRIRAGIPANAKLAHKTGTMPGVFNDVGVITSADGKQHVAIAIFTKTPKRAADDAPREKEIAELARAVYDAVTGD